MDRATGNAGYTSAYPMGLGIVQVYIRISKKKHLPFFNIDLGLGWMRMYSSQSTRVEVDYSGIKLNFISFHSNTRGLRWIYLHPNKALTFFEKKKTLAFFSEKKNHLPENVRRCEQHASVGPSGAGLERGPRGPAARPGDGRMDSFTRTLTPRLRSRASREYGGVPVDLGDRVIRLPSGRVRCPWALRRFGSSAFVAHSPYDGAGRSWPHRRLSRLTREFVIGIEVRVNICSSAFSKKFMSNYTVFCEWFQLNC
jgi:hypothetical protein